MKTCFSYDPVYKLSRISTQARMREASFLRTFSLCFKSFPILFNLENIGLCVVHGDSHYKYYSCVLYDKLLIILFVVLLIRLRIVRAMSGYVNQNATWSSLIELAGKTDRAEYVVKNNDGNQIIEQ